MTGIFVGDSAPSKIFVGDTQVSKVFVGDTQVRPTGGGGWTPGANTILYVPMKSDLLDHSNNQFTLTNNGVTLVQNQASIGVGYFDGSSYLSGANNSLFNFGDIHIGVWAFGLSLSSAHFLFAGINNGDIFFGYQNWIGVGRNGVAWDSRNSTRLNTNVWYYLSLDRTNNSLVLSLNTNTLGTYTNNKNYVTSGGYQIGNDGTGFTWNGYISDLIIENKGWTSTELSNYFDQTKGNYGIS